MTPSEKTLFQKYDDVSFAVSIVSPALRVLSNLLSVRDAELDDTDIAGLSFLLQACHDRLIAAMPPLDGQPET